MNNEYNILTNISIAGSVICYCLCSTWLMYYISRTTINVIENTPVEHLEEVQSLLEKGTLYRGNTSSNYTRKCIINDDYIKCF